MGGTTFTELDTLRDPDGVIIPVTYRFRDGHPRLSFCIQKEFERNGQTDKTVWLRPEHISAAERLLEKLPSFLELLEDRLRAAQRSARRGG